MIVGLKSALVDLFTDDPAGGRPVDGLTHVVRVSNGEPRPGELPKPVALTVSTGSVDAYDVTFIVRVYASTQTDALAAHGWVDETIAEVEVLMDQDARFTRGPWAINYFGELDALVGELSVTANRGDF